MLDFKRLLKSMIWESTYVWEYNNYFIILISIKTNYKGCVTGWSLHFLNVYLSLRNATLSFQYLKKEVYGYTTEVLKLAKD